MSEVGEKIVIQGRNCRFELNPADYPHLRFSKEPLPLRLPPLSAEDSVAADAMMADPTVFSGCSKISREEAYEFFANRCKSG